MRSSIVSVLAVAGALALGACGEATEDASLLGPEAAEARGKAVAADRGAPRPGDATIAEIAESAGFDLLLAAVAYVAETNPGSSLVEGLLNDDQLTVFAPTDQAFLNLVAAVSAQLNPTVLQDDGPFAAIDDLLGPGTVELVLSYHVVEGRRSANSVVPPVRDRVIETLSGIPFEVSSSGTIRAVGNGAAITDADISASNGIIHVIDAVLLPVHLGL